MKIFATVGTQRQEFPRFVKAIDLLDYEIKAQIGTTKFIPQRMENYYAISNEFSNDLKEADLIITHGGVGTILECLKLNKKIIVIPRLKKYNEHVDDHQLDMCNFVLENNYGLVCTDVTKLNNYIDEVKYHNFSKFNSNNEEFNRKLIDTIKQL